MSDCYEKNTRTKAYLNQISIRPTIVSKSSIADPSGLHIRSLKNDEVKQDCGTEYVLRSVNASFKSISDSS
jgi:2-keto-4-pentenoate hydratase/2-oxohepta-3-ene-1,7-dioic acid hydratase in catechol pathway